MRRFTLILAILLTCVPTVWADVFQDAENGNIQGVTAYLDESGNINAADTTGATALHHAVASNQVAVVKLLLEHKADVNAVKNDGVTPLHVAAAMGRTDIYNLLVAAGANPKTKDKKGRTSISLLRGSQQQPSAYSPAGSVLYRAYNGKKWGYIDRNGRMVVQPQFEEAAGFVDGLAPVTVLANKRYRWGYIDTSGKVAIEPQFTDARPFQEGLAVVVKDGVSSYIDRSGQMAFAGKTFSYAKDFCGGMAVVQLQGQEGTACIDKNGEVIVNAGNGHCYPTQKGVVLIQPEKGCCFLVDRAGRKIADIQGMYAYATRAEYRPESLIPVTTSGVYGKGKVGYADISGKIVIKPQFDVVRDFHEGLAAVGIGNPDSPMDCKWGYINSAGKMVIPAKYTCTGSCSGPGDFHEGLAAVCVGGRWGYVDKAGKLVIKPQYVFADIFEAGMANVGIGDTSNCKTAWIDRTGKVVWRAK